MRDDYKIVGPTERLDVRVEMEIKKQLDKMVQKTGLTLDELTNTAIKSYVSRHKDFLPKE